MNKKSLVAVAIWLVILSACATARESNDLPGSEIEYLDSIALTVRDSDAEEVARLRDSLREIEGFLEMLTDYSLVSGAAGQSSQRNDQRVRDLQMLLQRNGNRVLQRISAVSNDELPAARRSLAESVTNEHAIVAAQLELIRERRRELMRGLQMIRAYREGDRNALRGFNETTIISNQSYNLPTLPNDDQLDRTKRYIVEQLREEAEILTLINPDVNDYLRARKALDREMAALESGLDKAKKQITRWLGRHQVLASGLTGPGK